MLKRCQSRQRTRDRKSTLGSSFQRKAIDMTNLQKLAVILDRIAQESERARKIQSEITAGLRKLSALLTDSPPAKPGADAPTFQAKTKRAGNRRPPA